MATALIFLTAAVGHGLHAYLAFAGLDQPDHSVSIGWVWARGGWNVVTGAAGIYYWTIRRRNRALVGAMYPDPQRERLEDEADAHRAILEAVVAHAHDAIIGVNLDRVTTAWNGGRLWIRRRHGWAGCGSDQVGRGWVAEDVVAVTVGGVGRQRCRDG